LFTPNLTREEIDFALDAFRPMPDARGSTSDAERTRSA